jgi:hypothetical protein
MERSIYYNTLHALVDSLTQQSSAHPIQNSQLSLSAITFSSLPISSNSIRMRRCMSC